MSFSLDQDIRGWVAQYVSGVISLRKFQEWFAPRAWNIDSTGDAAAAQLASRIELLLAEFSNGDWTEEELRQKLSQYVLQGENILFDFREASWLQHQHISTGSVLGDFTKYYRDPPLLARPGITGETVKQAS